MKTFQKHIIGLLLFAFVTARAESIVTSVHNLSVNGSGTIKASSEADLCIFFVTPSIARVVIHRCGTIHFPA